MQKLLCDEYVCTALDQYKLVIAIIGHFSGVLLQMLIRMLINNGIADVNAMRVLQTEDFSRRLAKIIFYI